MAIVVALIVASCAGSDVDPADQADIPHRDAQFDSDVAVEEIVDVVLEPETAWEAALTGITDDGAVPLGVALQAFSLALAPLPGVELESNLAAGTDHLLSGTGAVNWVLRHWDDLTAAQQQAVGNILVDPASPDSGTSSGSASAIATVDRGAVPVVVAVALKSQPTVAGSPVAAEPQTKTGCWGQPLVDRDSAGAEVYRPELDELTGEIEARLGVSMQIPVFLVVETKARVNAAAYTWSNPIDCQSNQAAQCTIHLNPGLEMDGPHEVRAILAHELFHCFQFQYLGMHASDLPPWIGEGMAAWVGEDLAGGSLMSARWWKSYLTQPTKALFAREYDAIGFYAHADETGADPWLSALAVMDAFEGNAAFDVAVGTVAEQFLGSWPSGYARMPDLGSAWDTSMPGITSDQPTIPNRTIGAGAVLRLSTSAGTNRVVSLQFAADLIEIATDGHARITDGYSDDVVLGGASYCIRPGGCACPGGGDGGSLAPPLNPEAMVALTGGTAAASAEVRGRSIRCEEDPGADKSLVESCVVGTWHTDPFTVPGPLPGLDAVGGKGAMAHIAASGRLEVDFTAMEPLVSHDAQIGVTTEFSSTGRGSADVTTSGSTWNVSGRDVSGIAGQITDNIIGPRPIPVGPALYVLTAAGTYRCDPDQLTYITTDVVEGVEITITLRRSDR